MTVCHPARFSDPILELIAGLILPGSLVLDPFAGTGRIHELTHCATIGVEIEPEWAALHPDTRVGDATDLDFLDGTFDAVATSPCYGNRFADSHNARDGSRRRSYTHDLRAFTGDADRKLAANNAGKLHWGPAYRDLHEQAWREAFRVLKPGGLFVLNVSDHVRQRELQGVPAWHRGCCMAVGFDLANIYDVETRRMRQGENPERAATEEVQVYLRP